MCHGSVETWVVERSERDRAENIKLSLLGILTSFSNPQTGFDPAWLQVGRVQGCV